MTARHSLLPAALAAALFAAAAPAANALTLYDDFSGTTISPGRWWANESRAGGAVVGEARRGIVTGVMHMEIRGWGDRYSDAGSGRVSNRLNFTNATPVTTMKATVTPRAVSFATCSNANSTPSAVRFRLSGFFFNSGDASAGSEYNDVGAGVQAYRLSNSADAVGVLQISGFAYQCTDNDCVNTINVGTPVSLGTVSVGASVDLSVSWDKTNHKFVFQKNAETAQSITYTLLDSKPPVFNDKRLEAIADPQNCSAAARTTAFASVDFDNVYVNP